MVTSTHADAELERPAEKAPTALQRELLAQVAQLGHLTNTLKRRITFVSRSSQGQGSRQISSRLVVLRDRVARSIASVEATLQEAEAINQSPSPSQAAPQEAGNPLGTALQRAELLVAPQRWTPSETELQRGRAALLEEFDQPHNLPVVRFAQLAGKSKQQVYKDLQAAPARLLALGAGARGQRIPEWQLHERGRLLTQQVMRAAPSLDAWTIYHALTQPAGALGGRSPADAAVKGAANVDQIVNIVLEMLGVHASDVLS